MSTFEERIAKAVTDKLNDGTVVYEDGCFAIKWNNIKFLRKDLGYWVNLDGFQTICNIYDNPELLEEENVHGRCDQNH